MDDLIVIILTLIIIIAGIIGQAKKKPAENVLREEENKPAGEDDLWVLPGENANTRTNFRDIKIEEQPYKKTTTEQEQDTASVFNKDLTVKNKLEKLSGPGIKDNFSLRKAVIYNEILNRKYF